MRDLELIAIHIPKTAGSALINVLIRVYGRNAVQIYGRDTPQTDDYLNARWIKPKTRVLIGHFTYRQVARIHRVSGAGLVTFLRDPVERFVSNFYHFKSNKVHFSRFERFRRYEPLLIHMLFARYRNVIARYLDGTKIDRFVFVGFANSFQEDVIVLGRILGWPAEDSGPDGVFGEKTRVNDNEEFPVAARPLSSIARWLVELVNREDMIVYAAAIASRTSQEGDVDVARVEGAP